MRTRNNDALLHQPLGDITNMIFTARSNLNPCLTSHQSVRNLTPVFHETSAKLVAQWAKIFDQSHAEEVVIEVTNWAGRFA